jgi:hypothetical protein
MLINIWEDKLSRLMAKRDFQIFGKEFDKSLITGEKIITLQECIDDLKNLIK